MQLRRERHEEIETLLKTNVLEKHRYYVTAVMETIQFLAINELPLRGDKDGGYEFHPTEQDTIEDNIPSGLFMRLFEYTLAKDSKLAEIHKDIPALCKYTSPQIQNEVIEIMAQLVKEKIVSDVNNADVPYYTVKVDGTKDPTGKENVSIVIRFVLDGTLMEHLLSIQTTIDVDAESLARVVLKEMTDLGLDPQCIISQCYDGASVMSGRHGGVQAKLQEMLQREIPYVHCYNHQLHLVVVHAISEDVKVQQFFDICSSLYNFTRKHTVAAIYDGTRLKRLLDQRWTGHLETTEAILNNYDKLLDLLQHCAESALSAEIAVQATGLLAMMSNRQFLFIANFVRTLLTILEPANASLQSKTMDLLTASEIVNTVLESFKKFRSSDNFEDLFVSVFGVDTTTDGQLESGRSKRTIVMPHTLHDFVVTEHLPARTGPIGSVKSQREDLCSVYNGVVDRTVSEIETRFSAKNISLLKSLKALTSFDETFFSIEKLKTLAMLCGVDMESTRVHTEIEVARNFFTLKQAEVGFPKLLHPLTAFAFQFKDAFPTAYRLLASGLTVGASTSTCEASFSALTRVLTPYRRSMLHQRKADLVLLSYEHGVTKNVDVNDFLIKFNSSKTRRLRLY